jgi:hypothetical protein
MPTLRYSWLHIFSLFLIFTAILGSFLFGYPNQISKASVPATAPTPPNFTAPVYYDSGGLSTNNGGQPILGDFNGDAKPDIAVANYDSSNFAVLLGNGNGSFQTPLTTTTSARPLGLASGDFNGDNKLDLVITHFTVNGVNGVYPVDIFLGDGTGHFSLAHTYTSGLNTMFAVVIDINKDGKLDIVVNNNGGGTMSVLLGNGDGSFQNAINTTSASPNPGDFVVADFNGDGNLDLGIEDGPNLISFFMGNGDGTFQSPTSYSAGKSAFRIKTADFNGDGKLDLVGGLEPPNYDFVLLGNGDGTFNPISTSNPSNSLTHFIGMADFTGDNKADLAWFHPGSGTTQLKILAGIGDGTFQPVLDCTLNSQVFDVVVGDVNGDNKPDMVLSNIGISKVTVLLSAPAPSLSISDTSVTEGNSGTASAVFTVTMTAACCQSVIVNYATADGTATTADNDYVATSGTLTFVPGETSKTITATVKGDPKFEPDETFFVNLTLSPGNVTISKAQGTATIINDDTQPVVSINNVSQNEGNSGTTPFTFTVSLSNPSSQPITVTYQTSDGTAITADSDYQAAGGSFTFNPGETSHPVTVLVNGDTRSEADETFKVTLSNPLNATLNPNLSVGIGTITNDDSCPTSQAASNPVATGPGLPAPAAWVPPVRFTPSIDTGRTYATGTAPRAVITGDFNGDGKDDMVTANTTNINSLSLFLGNGDGSFQPARNFNSGNANPFHLAAADLNGDNKLDLVVANRYNYTANVSILLGNGDGTFQSPTNLNAEYDTVFVLIKDLNGDNKLDLVAVNGGGLDLNLFLGNGNGTFQASTTVRLDYYFTSVVAGDFNGDNKLDLAAIRGYPSGSVDILTGNGNGTFQAPVAYTIPSQAALGIVGDFNKDNKSDLAIADGDSNKLSLLLGNGDGTFQSAVNFTALTGSGRLVAGDFNKDGNLDVVIAAGTQGNVVSILLGTGTGSFQTPLTAPVGNVSYYVATSDFNGDGKLDLTVVNGSDNNVQVLIGNGDGTFGFDYKTGNGPRAVVIGDFNSDCKDDLITANSFDNNLSLFLGRGDGSFQKAVNFNAGNTYPFHLAAADLNGDNKLDLVVVNRYNSTGNISIFLGNGDGTFQAPTNLSAEYDTVFVLIKDLNGDNKLDLVVTNGGGTDLNVFLGNGNGTFQPPLNIPVDLYLTTVSAGDFNGDTKVDLVATCGSLLYVLIGHGDGTFQAPVAYNIPEHAALTLVGDFNNDSKSDLVVAGGDSNQVSLLIGNGDGTFHNAVNFTALTGSGRMAEGDFNGDGNMDVAVAGGTQGNVVSVLLGTGSGSFQAPVTFPVGNYSYYVATKDLNGDGKLDLVVVNGNDNNISILLNTSPYYAVTLPDDNGNLSLDGSLSKALNQATAGQYITFLLPNAGKVVNVTHSLPAPKPGVTIVGACTASGPGIIIQGNGLAGDGLVLNGGVNLWGVKVSGFNGVQIKVNSTSGSNRLLCVKAGG